MPIDPNIILQGKPPQIDPMAIAQNATALQTGMNQNRLFASDFTARQAIGEHYRQAIDPRTGQLDTNKLTGLVAGDPRSAFRAGDVAKDALEREQSQVALGTARVGQEAANVDLIKKKLGAFNQGLSALLTKPDVTNDDIIGQASQWVSRGVLSNDEAVQELSTLPPPTGDPIKDAAARKEWLQQHYLQTAEATQQFDAAFGTPTTTDTGAKIVMGRTNPITGYAPVAQFNKELSPETLSTPTQTGVGPGGEPIYGTRADFIGKAAGGGIPMAPAAGEVEYKTQSASRATEIGKYAEGSPQRLAAMQAVRSLVPTTPGQAFGPTHNLTSQVGKLAAAWNIPFIKNADGQASIDEINKSLSLVAAQQAQAMGAGTDAGKAMIHDANPSFANSREGMLGNLSIVEGNERYMVAKNRALQNYMTGDPARGIPPHPASDARKFETRFNNEIPPQVFQVQTMSPANQKRVWESMSGKQEKDGSWTGDKGRFIRGLVTAQKNGWLEGQ